MLSIRKIFGPRPGAAQVRGLKKRKRERELPTKTEGEVRGATGARLSEAAAQLCRGPRCSRIWPGEGGARGGYMWVGARSSEVLLQEERLGRQALGEDVEAVLERLDLLLARELPLLPGHAGIDARRAQHLELLHAVVQEYLVLPEVVERLHDIGGGHLVVALGLRNAPLVALDGRLGLLAEGREVRAGLLLLLRGLLDRALEVGVDRREHPEDPAGLGLVALVRALVDAAVAGGGHVRVHRRLAGHRLQQAVSFFALPARPFVEGSQHFDGVLERGLALARGRERLLVLGLLLAAELRGVIKRLSERRELHIRRDDNLHEVILLRLELQDRRRERFGVLQAVELVLGLLLA